MVLEFKNMFDDHWNGLTDAQRTEEARHGRQWLDEFERTELTSEEQAEVEALRREYEAAAKALASHPEKQIHLCVAALAAFSTPHAAVLRQQFTKEFITLLTGRLKRKSEPRKWTSDIVAEAQALFREFHTRAREARSFCNKHSRATGKAAANYDAELNPRKPRIPKELINDLPRHKSSASKSPQEIAIEWTAMELNRRHKKLGATVSYLRRHVLMRNIEADLIADKTVM